MTASEGSFVGFAKQTAKGTPNVTDASFKYMLFNDGGMGPDPITIPLDPEVGGGAMLRDVARVGVISRGQFSFVPRPQTLGDMLYAATGNVATTASGTAKSHVFTLGANQFAAPYYTFRSAPGNMWGEQFQDCRLNSLSLAWKGANFVRGEMGVVGGLPLPVSTAAWAAITKVDGGPQFLTPVSKIEVPDATVLKVLSGMFTCGMSIPLDEQFVVGSYSPDAMDITRRAFQLSFVIKLEDSVLYKKLLYDAAGGAAWAAAMMREATLDIMLNSVVEADTVAHTPYSLKIAANGSSTSTANVVWSAQPVAMRAGKQVTMAMTGTFIADPAGGEPITLTLVNNTASY